MIREKTPPRPEDKQNRKRGMGEKVGRVKGPKDQDLKTSTHTMSLALTRILCPSKRMAEGKDRTSSGLQRAKRLQS